MIEQEEPDRDLAGLGVPLAGRLAATGDQWEPYRLLDAGGVSVAAAGVYFGHLQAAGRSELTIRSYGMDLLRWFRFLRAIGVPWNHAVRSDARDSAGGCRSRGNRSGRTGESRIAMVPGSLRWLRAWLIHRRCARIARRCCAAL
jgi:Phage integrase, N-terminal SAM-like domain